VRVVPIRKAATLINSEASIKPTMGVNSRVLSELNLR
jgi:hypothetical protein